MTRLTNANHVAGVHVKIERELVTELLSGVDYHVVDFSWESSKAHFDQTIETMDRRIELPCCVMLVGRLHKFFCLKYVLQ